ncbi:rhodanese-like domain-containing protein [Patescibacteria group bacterium]
MKNYLKTIIIGLFLVNSMDVALAVPPPDFLFNLGSSIAQVFSVIAIFASAAIAASRQYFKTYFMAIKHKKLVWTLLGFLVIGGSFSGAYFYQQYQQDQAYADWVAQNEVEDEFKLEVKEEEEKEEQKEKIPRNDVYQTFIATYYQNIAEGNYEDAYEVSKKTVDFETFRGWYQDVQEMAVEEIEKLGELEYKVLVKLMESEETSTYEVVMTLDNVDDGIKIASSNSNLVKTENSNQENPEPDPGRNVSMSVSNGEFANLVNSGNAYVLDAREDEEFEYGRFPGSNHIRFVDLFVGEWQSLPKDKTIYVLCWSGMRGGEVAEFLKGKGLDARYLEDGASGWVEYGGVWDGEIDFSDLYTGNQYTKLLSVAEMRAEMDAGAVIVDSREPSKYAEWHIPGSINIPVIHTPSSEMEAKLVQVASGSRVITVCDAHINCFDAKLGGLKVERRGNVFLGRFDNPSALR